VDNTATQRKQGVEPTQNLGLAVVGDPVEQIPRFSIFDMVVGKGGFFSP